MRLRNVKNKEEILSSSKLFIEDPTTYKGNWHSVFSNKNKIHVEIGMGKGDFLIGMSKMYPDINFIGIEKYDSVLAKAVKKFDNEDFSNVRIIRMDAKEIEEVFDKEITKIYLNFSDPWPKNRHSDRRLTSHVFLKKYDSIFKDKREIIQKTDNVGLFEYSIISLSKYGYIFEEISLDLHNSEITSNVVTEYEMKFSDSKIKYIRATKCIK